MHKIDKNIYRTEVLRVLELVKKPIWISALSSRYGLPYVSLYNTNKNSPTQQVLKQMIKDKEIYLLEPRYYKLNSKNPRRMICLPPYTKVAQNSRSYRDLLLAERLERIEIKINSLVEKLKKNGIY